MKLKFRLSTFLLIVASMAIGAIAHSLARSMEVTFANVGVGVIILLVIAVVISTIVDTDDK